MAPQNSMARSKNLQAHSLLYRLIKDVPSVFLIFCAGFAFLEGVPNALTYLQSWYSLPGPPDPPAFIINANGGSLFQLTVQTVNGQYFMMGEGDCYPPIGPYNTGCEWKDIGSAKYISALSPCETNNIHFLPLIRPFAEVVNCGQYTTPWFEDSYLSINQHRNEPPDEVVTILIDSNNMIWIGSRFTQETLLDLFPLWSLEWTVGFLILALLWQGLFWLGRQAVSQYSVKQNY